MKKSLVSFLKSDQGALFLLLGVSALLTFRAGRQRALGPGNPLGQHRPANVANWRLFRPLSQGHALLRQATALYWLITATAHLMGGLALVPTPALGLVGVAECLAGLPDRRTVVSAKARA
jgi:hypothetical protein